MVDDGEIVADYFAPTLPLYYRLPETTALKHSHVVGNNPHEFLKAQLYTALELTGLLDEWGVEKEKNKFGIIPDATSIFNGKLIFWEVDRGTEDYMKRNGIQGKLDRYLEMSKTFPDVRFHVCFTTITEFDRFSKIKRHDYKRAQSIHNLIDTYNRADQFLVTTHNYALSEPLGDKFSSAKHPQGVSLLAI